MRESGGPDHKGPDPLRVDMHELTFSSILTGQGWGFIATLHMRVWKRRQVRSPALVTPLVGSRSGRHSIPEPWTQPPTTLEGGRCLPSGRDAGRGGLG